MKTNNRLSLSKEKNNKSRFYTIILFLLIISYILWFWQFNFCTINAHLLSSLILSIPIVLIGLIFYLSKREKIKDRKGKKISIILIIIFLILSFLTSISVMVEEGTSHEESIQKYKHIYNIAGYKKIRFHFPSEIQQDLIQNNKAKFYYRPQFLQGGFCFELLMEMTNSEIDAYIEKYKELAKEKMEVNEKNYVELYNKYGIENPTIFKYKEGKDFFINSEIYLFDYNSYKPNNWNHGYVYYMAKNNNLKKLLLVTEVW